MNVHFGEFVLEPDTRRLLRGTDEVRLGPKAFELLELLVDRRPRALSKAHLRDRLWPRGVVAESSLATLVGELRSALGDDPRRPLYIRTVFGFGYAFCGAVAELAGPDLPVGSGARLLWREQEFALRDGENVIGRAAGVPVRIRGRTVSRRHARICLSSGLATLEDLGSKNGTFVGDERLRSPRQLEDGDEIRLGEIPVRFRASSGTSSTAAADSRDRRGA